MTYDIFSKRDKVFPDIYQYGSIPNSLRVQIIKILEKELLFEGLETQETVFYDVYETLCEEYGIFSLVEVLDYSESNFGENEYFKIIKHWILFHPHIDKVLDAVGLSFNFIFPNIDKPLPQIQKLNSRFREHGLGYQFESGKIIRIDSQIIHSEVVKPVLYLLRDPVFKGANEEFLKAHEYYKHGDYEGCLIECLKSFESTMKIICKKRNWNYLPKDTASKLIGVCADNGLFEASLKSFLSSSIPTIRNTMAGHGQGSQITNVPQHIAELQLHLTATIILFLIESDKALPIQPNT